MEKVGINNEEGRGTVPLYTTDKHLVRFFYQIEENKIIIKTTIMLHFCTKLFFIKHHIQENGGDLTLFFSPYNIFYPNISTISSIFFL